MCVERTGGKSDSPTPTWPVVDNSRGAEHCGSRFAFAGGVPLTGFRSWRLRFSGWFGAGRPSGVRSRVQLQCYLCASVGAPVLVNGGRGTWSPGSVRGGVAPGFDQCFDRVIVVPRPAPVDEFDRGRVRPYRERA